MLDHEIITRDDYSQVISDVATSQNKIVVFGRLSFKEISEKTEETKEIL